MKTNFKNAQIVGKNVSNEEYLRQNFDRGNPDFVMSRSQLMNFSSNPRRWLAGYGADDGDTKSTEWGSLIDCLVLQPDQFDHRYEICPETYKSDKGEVKEWNWNANVCKSWRDAAKQAGKTVVKFDTHALATEAAKKLLDEPIVKELVGCSERQVMVTAVYCDAKTGIQVPVKTLLDLVPGIYSRFAGSLGDLKTSMSANPADWRRLVWQRGYDIQAAFFTDIFNAATGEQRETWFHIVQENFSPFEVCSPMPVLSSEFLELGRMKYISALRQYAHCLATKTWPSFSPVGMQIEDFQIIEPDAFMLGKDTEKQWVEPFVEQSEKQTSEMPS